MGGGGAPSSGPLAVQGCPPPGNAALGGYVGPAVLEDAGGYPGFAAIHTKNRVFETLP